MIDLQLIDRGEYYKYLIVWKDESGVDMTIAEIRLMNQAEKIAVTKHARDRLTERGIQIDDVVSVIDNGEIIKEYTDDKPFPSCLVLGKSLNGKAMHLVISRDKEWIYLITAYFPDVEQWEADFKTRKGR